MRFDTLVILIAVFVTLPGCAPSDAKSDAMDPLQNQLEKYAEKPPVGDQTERYVLKRFFQKIKEAEKVDPDTIFPLKATTGNLPSSGSNVERSGFFVCEIFDNIFVAFELENGTPDGIVVVYQKIPHYVFLSCGQYKDGKPSQGDFSFLFEKKMLLAWRLHYVNGVFEKFLKFHSPATAFTNEISNGKIVNGYDIKAINAESNITLSVIKNGQETGVVSSDIFKTTGFDPDLALDYLNGLRKQAKWVKDSDYGNDRK